MIGMLATGIFANEVGLIAGSARTLLVHCLALGLVTIFSFLGSYLLYRLTDAIIPLRVSEEQEEMGLDLSQHGESMQQVAAIATHTLEARLARPA